jgi:hypothetical protein
LACLVANHFHRCSVGSKLVCHDDFWLAVTFHRFTQNSQCSIAIPHLGDERFKDLSFVINCPPEVKIFSV